MKKILALVLALCLTMALTCTAFADKSPTLDPSPVVDPSPDLHPNASANGSAPASVAKFTYSATDANGVRVAMVLNRVESGAEYDEVKAYGVKGVFNINILSNTTGPVTIDVYCPGASNSSKVIVRDDWELLEGASLKVNGDRISFTADAEVINKWHYFAVVDNFDAVKVDTPMEGGDNGEDVEGDTTNVNDNENNETKPEKNPTTGVVLAVVPMMVAAAAIIASKKR